jgi:3'-phosphoadenosine 5'-phosphosulfate sulfotransferase (PAPS reductase)/FAD synthetase
MTENPPTFRISAKCCTYAKKEVAAKYEREHDYDLICTGVRKAEKGARTTRYSTCYTQAMAGPDAYRPLFWFSDADKAEYDRHYEITHSDCYEVWGMKRTGCPGCPFGKDFEEELELTQKYEPNFYKAANKIFGQSYEYTRQYLKFREEMKKKATEGLEPNEEQASFEI